jgi:hypothetical protein
METGDRDCGCENRVKFREMKERRKAILLRNESATRFSESRCGIGGHGPAKSCVRVKSGAHPITVITAVQRYPHLVPCVNGSELARTFFTSQTWSVRPCVRPVGAVRMTAGHNALRGSGPGQNHAFKDALARVGCPDRRIDRLCITCCSPSQPLHHTGCPA